MAFEWVLEYDEVAARVSALKDTRVGYGTSTYDGRNGMALLLKLIT